MIIMKQQSVAILAQGKGPKRFSQMRSVSRALYFFVFVFIAVFSVMSLLGSVSRMASAVAGKASSSRDAQERSSHPQLPLGLAVPPPPPAFLPRMVPKAYFLEPVPEVAAQRPWIAPKIVQQLVYTLASLCELDDNIADSRAVQNSSMNHSQLI